MIVRCENRGGPNPGLKCRYCRVCYDPPSGWSLATTAATTTDYLHAFESLTTQMRGPFWP